MTRKTNEENTAAKKMDPYSLIAFILMILFIILEILIFLFKQLVRQVERMPRINPYTVQEITNFAIFSTLWYILPFIIVLALAIIGYRRTIKDSTLKGKSLASNALYFSIIYLVFALVIVGGQVKNWIEFKGDTPECGINYPGKCSPQDQCPDFFNITTNCDEKNMVCCRENIK